MCFLNTYHIHGEQWTCHTNDDNDDDDDDCNFGGGNDNNDDQVEHDEWK